MPVDDEVQFILTSTIEGTVSVPMVVNPLVNCVTDPVSIPVEEAFRIVALLPIFSEHSKIRVVPESLNLTKILQVFPEPPPVE